MESSLVVRARGRRAAADCTRTDGAYSISRLGAYDIYCHRCTRATAPTEPRWKNSFPQLKGNIPDIAGMPTISLTLSLQFYFHVKLGSSNIKVVRVNMQARSRRHLVLLVKSDAGNTIYHLHATRARRPQVFLSKNLSHVVSGMKTNVWISPRVLVEKYAQELYYVPIDLLIARFSSSPVGW